MSRHHDASRQRPDATVLAGARSRLDEYQSSFNNQQQGNDTESNGDVHELVYTDHWSHNDLTRIFS